MSVYILVLVFILLNCLLESEISTIKIYNKNINVRSLSFGLSYFYILLLGLLRNEGLGVDVANYKIYYNNLYNIMSFKDIISSRNIDSGYAILNKIIYLFTQDFRILEVIIFIISFTIFSLIIYKRSYYPSMSFLIYMGLGFIGINLCILRQAIAYSLCFASFDYLKRDKYIQYFLLLGIAVSFHKTAIFFIITLYIKFGSNIKNRFIRESILIAVSLLSSYLILPQIYQYYKNDYSIYRVAGEGYKILIIYAFLSVLLYYLTRNKKSIDFSYDFEGSKLSVYSQIIALQFSLFTRVTNYFALIFTISIPNIIHDSRNRKLYSAIFISVFSALYIYGLYNNQMSIVPYISIFN